MSDISPQGYEYGQEPRSINPFWGGGGSELVDVTATATVDDTTGTPAVEVTKTGTSTVNLDFAFTGLKGEAGAQGETGPAGPQGEQGPQGIQGETGATGPQGETGPQGPAGPQGETGPAGTDGVTPVIAATATVDSTTGTPAVQVTKTGTDDAPSFEFAFTGLKGETGETGAQGETGPQGATGETGATGPQGETGPQGPAGADGTTPVITATATVDSTTGTPAVQVTKTGTDDAPSFEFAFTGLKGEAGATGGFIITNPSYSKTIFPSSAVTFDMGTLSYTPYPSSLRMQGYAPVVSGTFYFRIPELIIPETKKLMNVKVYLSTPLKLRYIAGTNYGETGSGSVIPLVANDFIPFLRSGSSLGGNNLYLTLIKPGILQDQFVYAEKKLDPESASAEDYVFDITFNGVTIEGALGKTFTITADTYYDVVLGVKLNFAILGIGPSDMAPTQYNFSENLTSPSVISTSISSRLTLSGTSIEARS